MKVPYEKTSEYQLFQFIQKIRSDIFLREDLKNFDNERQLSRALKALTDQEKIVKIGYGIYVKLSYSKLTNSTYLPKGFLTLAREALTRLGIEWEISQAEKAYNNGATQQVSLNPPTKLKSSFRRTLNYKGQEIRYE